jgi:hypothetical protein
MPVAWAPAASCAKAASSTVAVRSSQSVVEGDTTTAAAAGTQAGLPVSVALGAISAAEITAGTGKTVVTVYVAGRIPSRKYSSSSTSPAEALGRSAIPSGPSASATAFVHCVASIAAQATASTSSRCAKTSPSVSANCAVSVKTAVFDCQRGQATGGRAHEDCAPGAETTAAAIGAISAFYVEPRNVNIL